MTKEQAVLELRQALSKVDGDLRLFGATEGQQAADRTWGALEHDMAVLQTTWKQIRAEQAPSEVKIIGPYPSAEQVHQEIGGYEARGWHFDGEQGNDTDLERNGAYYFARVTRPRLERQTG